MTITKAAAQLDKSDMTVRTWLKNGYIQGVKIGKIWEIPQTEIDRIRAGGLNVGCEMDKNCN